MSIRQVVIYTGHHANPVLGPYAENIRKRIEMFQKLNPYRIDKGRPPWEVIQASGENLVRALHDPKRTLLVIPAGQSTHLDQVFSTDQLSFIKHRFFGMGGKGYMTCGSAYWTSKTRIYDDVCSQQPSEKKRIIKESRIPLFKGSASGPLCFHLSPEYKVGFYSDAITVKAKKGTCTVLLSGGGSFHPKKEDKEVEILAKYPHSELMRCGKTAAECPQSDIAAILVRTQKKGAAILSMFHPYYGSQDLDPERYERAFPGSGTDWAKIVERLSPENTRMNFILENFLFPLEDL